MPLKIESVSNPHVKKILHLKKPRRREESQLFLIEGYRELLRATEASFPVETVYYCPALFLKDNEMDLINALRAAGAPAYELSQKAFEKISYRDRPDGLFALGQMKKHHLSLFSPKENGLYLAMERVEKPGNLGSMLRTCDAAGIDGVFVLDPQTDIYNPNVVRSSVGTLFTLPIFVGSSADAIGLFQQHNIAIAAALCDASEQYTNNCFNKSVVIVMGSEQCGLTHLWQKAATDAVSIPMHGISDSLNVSTAASILIYEALRQRNLRY